jgi:hypothetical protein
MLTSSTKNAAARPSMSRSSAEVCAIPSTGFPFPVLAALKKLTTNRRSGCRKIWASENSGLRPSELPPAPALSVEMYDRSRVRCHPSHRTQKRDHTCHHRDNITAGRIPMVLTCLNRPMQSGPGPIGPPAADGQSLDAFTQTAWLALRVGDALRVGRQGQPDLSHQHHGDAYAKSPGRSTGQPAGDTA